MPAATTPALTLNNGVTMPALGLGVFQSPPEQTAAAVEAALATGYRHIDTAAAYGNEREVGEAIRDSGLDRSDVFLETKIWISDYGYHQTLHGFEKSAGKLGVEQIALLILHQPLPSAFERTLEAYRPGDAARRRQGPRDRRQQLHGRPPHGLREDPAITQIADAHGRTPAQVMLRWGLQHGRSVIPKSTKPERIAENIDIFDFELTADDMAAIDGLETGKRGGPEPEAIPLEAFGRDIPEA